MSLRGLFLALVLCSGCASPGALSAVSRDRGRLECEGSGEPVVVFIAGASRHASDWKAAQRLLAPAIHSCAWEPPEAGVRTARSDAQLLRGEIAPLGQRFVLVGHSYGGLVVRTLAASLGSAVVGVLFVDAVSEDAFDPRQAPALSDRQRIDWRASFTAAVDAGLPAGVRVIALVADQHGQAGWENWLREQQALVARGSPGEVIVVPRSGHMIPLDRPDAIAEAAQRLVTGCSGTGASVPPKD